MFTIQVFNTIAKAGLNQFPSELYQLKNIQSEHEDAIILRSQSLHDRSVSPKLKAIARAGAGVNNIPVDKMSALGIPVFNTPGANANAVKELVLASLLLACRNLCEGWQATKRLSAPDIEKQVEVIKKDYAGYELPGKTLAVIGLGAIGVKVANCALAMGMNVKAFDPHITIQNAWQLSSEVNQANSLLEAAKDADFLTVHVPASEKTKHLISQAVLAHLKPSSVVLNFSRASLVDQSALLLQLDNGKLARYVTDFPDEKLITHSQVLCLPHLGASTLEAEENCAFMAAKQLRDFLEKGHINHSVNFPTVSMPYQSGTRIAITNQNIPNMLSQISAFFADKQLNILDMINRSRGQLAYTLLDIDADLASSVCSQLLTINGVINARRLPIQMGSLHK